MVVKEKSVSKFEEHSDYFTRLYGSGGWGPASESSSGGGSSVVNTVEYRKFLQKFIKDNEIKRVYDFGCGDWTFSKLIDWGDIQYTGVETVKSLVDDILYKYRTETIKFVYMKNASTFYTRKGDLLILKDVLQHWNNQEIVEFLDHVTPNFKYILITNSRTQSEDWQDGENRNRPLSCKFYPLKKFKPETVLIYGEKEVSLIE